VKICVAANFGSAQTKCSFAPASCKLTKFYNNVRCLFDKTTMNFASGDWEENYRRGAITRCRGYQ